MIFKIFGYGWFGIGLIGWISSCSDWIQSGKIGDHDLNYALSEKFLLRMIIYFFIFILPGLVLIYLGRKKNR